MTRDARALPVALLLVFIAACASTSPSNPCPPPSVQPAPLVAMVVGTEHRGHLVTPGYPMTKLGALLDAFAPDLVLVEIRPEAFARNELEDGPIEMSYLTMLARAKGIRVAPIDWWRDDDLGAAPPVVDRDGDAIFEREFGDLARKLDRYDTFEALNAPERAAAALELRNAQTRLGAGEGVVWERRQAWFHDRARKAIDAFKPKRVQAFVGFSHRPELEAFLRARGSTAVDPRSILAEPGSTEIPDDVIAFWDGASKRLAARAARSSGADQKALEAKAAYWTVAVRQRGRCCAP